MLDIKFCPHCNIEWEKKQTIYEHFLEKELKVMQEQKNDILSNEDIVSIQNSAKNIAVSYGCTEETPRHFSINVVGIEDPYKYDGVSYWKCTSCNTVFDRWTMKELDLKL